MEDLVSANIPRPLSGIFDDHLFCGIGVIVGKGDNDNFEDLTCHKNAWIIYSKEDLVHVGEEHIAILYTK